MQGHQFCVHTHGPNPPPPVLSRTQFEKETSPPGCVRTKRMPPGVKSNLRAVVLIISIKTTPSRLIGRHNFFMFYVTLNLRYQLDTMWKTRVVMLKTLQKYVVWHASNLLFASSLTRMEPNFGPSSFIIFLQDAVIVLIAIHVGAIERSHNESPVAAIAHRITISPTSCGIYYFFFHWPIVSVFHIL